MVGASSVRIDRLPQASFADFFSAQLETTQPSPSSPSGSSLEEGSPMGCVSQERQVSELLVSLCLSTRKRRAEQSQADFLTSLSSCSRWPGLPLRARSATLTLWSSSDSPSARTPLSHSRCSLSFSGLTFFHAPPQATTTFLLLLLALPLLRPRLPLPPRNPSADVRSHPSAVDSVPKKQRFVLWRNQRLWIFMLANTVQAIGHFLPSLYLPTFAAVSRRRSDSGGLRRASWRLEASLQVNADASTLLSNSRLVSRELLDQPCSLA